MVVFSWLVATFEHLSVELRQIPINREELYAHRLKMAQALRSSIKNGSKVLGDRPASA